MLRLSLTVKADEFTESQDLHEIYNDRPFCLAASSIARFYSSKVVGTSICFARDIIFRDCPWRKRRNTVRARRRIDSINFMKSANHLCRTGYDERAIVLESISIYTGLLVCTHLWWRTNFKSHEEIIIEHRDCYYKTSIVLLRVHETFRSNMHNRSRKYSYICQQFLRICYVRMLHETFWSFISAAMTPNYQDHIGKIFNDSETVYQKCVICIISTVKASCGKCTNTFISHCTFSNAIPAAGFLRIIFNKLSLFPARYDTKRLSRATVSYNTFITRAGQTRASIDDWLVP